MCKRDDEDSTPFVCRTVLGVTHLVVILPWVLCGFHALQTIWFRAMAPPGRVAWDGRGLGLNETCLLQIRMAWEAGDEDDPPGWHYVEDEVNCTSLEALGGGGGVNSGGGSYGNGSKDCVCDQQHVVATLPVAKACLIVGTVCAPLPVILYVGFGLANCHNERVSQKMRLGVLFVVGVLIFTVNLAGLLAGVSVFQHCTCSHELYAWQWWDAGFGTCVAAVVFSSLCLQGAVVEVVVQVHLAMGRRRRPQNRVLPQQLPSVLITIPPPNAPIDESAAVGVVWAATPLEDIPDFDAEVNCATSRGENAPEATVVVGTVVPIPSHTV